MFRMSTAVAGIFTTNYSTIFANNINSVQVILAKFNMNFSKTHNNPIMITADDGQIIDFFAVTPQKYEKAFP
jgi:hypothetical protein